MGDEVERAAIQVVGGNDMVTGTSDVLQGVGHCGGATGDGKSCDTTLQGCDTVLEHTLCRVGQTTIDVTSVAQSETVGGML